MDIVIILLTLAILFYYIWKIVRYIIAISIEPGDILKNPRDKEKYIVISNNKPGEVIEVMKCKLEKGSISYIIIYNEIFAWL